MSLFANQISAARQLRGWLVAENYFYTKLLCAALVSVLAIAGLAVFFIFSAYNEQRQDIARNHALDTLRTASAIENELDGMETGLRAYLLTADASYVSTFDLRKSLIDTQIGKLSTLLNDESLQTKRIQQVKQNIDQWYQQVAVPGVQRRDSAQAASATTATLGKSLIDETHNVFEGLQRDVQASLDAMASGRKANLTYEVLLITPKLRNAISEMEKAEWGFLLTGDRGFLETYKQSVGEFYNLHGYLSVLETGNRPQLALLGKTRAGVEYWLAQTAQTAIAAKQEGRDPSPNLSHNKGKETMDNVHIAFSQFERNELDAYLTLNLHSKIQRIAKTAGLAAVCVLATFFLIASSWYSFRAYSRHLGKIESAEEQTRSIIATVADGIITLTDQGVILTVNPATEKMFGFKSAELVGQSIAKIIPQRLFVHDMIKLGRGTMMTVGQRQNYFPFPVELSVSEMKVSQGKCYVALVRDMTEAKRTEETLRHIGMGVSAATGKEFVRSLVKQLSKALNSDFSFVVETIRKGDENACSIIIAEQGNIRSKTNYKLANTPFDEVLRKGFRAYSNVVRDHYPNDEILKELDVRSLVATPLVDHKGRAVGVMGVLSRKPIENIEVAESTLQIFAARAAAEIERQRYEDDLGAEKERLAVTLRSIGDGVITTDVDGRVLMLNNIAEKLTGWSQEMSANHPLTDVFTICNDRSRKPAVNAVERIIETGSAVGLANHVLLVSRDGAECIIEASASPIRDKMNKKIGVVLVFRDITEKQRAEEERRKTEKLESLGVAAGGIAHDFNNLLTGILGNLSLALITIDPKDDLAERLKTAKKAALRAQELAQQLLTFAKGGAPVKKTASIGKLIADTVKFAIRDAKVQAEFAVPETLWPVEIDAAQISQVVTNLTINAEEAMPAGGILEVKCENFTLEAENPALPSLRPGRYIKITVQDEGVGIPAEYMKKIFDPYFTTKPKGSGLGLATSYSIVKNHEGIITVESAAGSGSKFCVYLPATDKQLQFEKAAAQPPKPGSGGNILVMDDEEVICELVTHTLTPIGYTVTEANDALTCIRLYDEAMKAGKPFDAVIMDLTLPGGMGGQEAVKRLIALNPAVKAIVSSGYAMDPVMSNHREYGFCAMLAKPYEIADLARVVNEVVGPKDETLVFHDFVQMQTA